MGTGVSVGQGVLVGWAETAVSACVLPTDVGMAVGESTTASGVQWVWESLKTIPRRNPGRRYRFAGVKDLDAVKMRLHAPFTKVEEALDAAQVEMGRKSEVTLMQRPPQFIPRVSV